MKAPVRVLVCRVGRAPEVTTIAPGPSGSFLDAMQAIVGGYVQMITPFADRCLELWCNEDGLALNLPLNLTIPTIAPALPAGFDERDVVYRDPDCALPGERAEWRIHGDCFFARSTPDGELAPVTDEDVQRFTDGWTHAHRVPSALAQGAAS